MCGPLVGLYNLTPVDPQLERAWFQTLNPLIEKLVSKFAFKFNLCRCTLVLCQMGRELKARGVYTMVRLPKP
jgi:hypothetical protein